MSGAPRSRAVAVGLAPPLAAAAVFGTLWVPWVRTGTTERSAFRVVSALRGAGLIHRTPAEAFFAVIATLPGIVAAVWVLWAARYHRAAAVAAALAGALAITAAAGVREVAHHRAAGTLALTTTAGAVTVAVSAFALFAHRLSPERPAP